MIRRQCHVNTVKTSRHVGAQFARSTTTTTTSTTTIIIITVIISLITSIKLPLFAGIKLKLTTLLVDRNRRPLSLKKLHQSCLHVPKLLSLFLSIIAPSSLSTDLLAKQNLVVVVDQTQLINRKAKRYLEASSYQKANHYQRANRAQKANHCQKADRAQRVNRYPRTKAGHCHRVRAEQMHPVTRLLQ